MIQDKAILVSLTVKEPSGSKKDREAAEAVEREFDTASGSGSFSKALFGESLREYSRAKGKIRDYFNSRTLPWGENGIRILPSASLFKFREDVEGFKKTLAEEAEKVVDALPEIKAAAMVRLGKLYRETEFPTPAQLRAKLGIRVKFYPLPNTTDFRVTLSMQEKAILEEQLRETLEDTQKAATADLLKRMSERVKGLLLTLDKDKAPKEETLKRALDLCQSCKELNLWGDPEITRNVGEIEKTLSGKTEAALSQSSVERKVLSTSLQEVMEKMSGFMGTAVIIPEPEPVPDLPPFPPAQPQVTMGFIQKKPTRMKIVDGNVVYQEY